MRTGRFALIVNVSVSVSPSTSVTFHLQVFRGHSLLGVPLMRFLVSLNVTPGGKAQLNAYDKAPLPSIAPGSVTTGEIARPVSHSWSSTVPLKLGDSSGPTRIVMASVRAPNPSPGLAGMIGRSVTTVLRTIRHWKV